VSPRKPMLMPPDDSADSTGGRLEARYPSSRRGHKRVLSHRWGSQGLSRLRDCRTGRRPSQVRSSPNNRQEATAAARPKGANSRLQARF